MNEWLSKMDPRTLRILSEGYALRLAEMDDHLKPLLAARDNLAEVLATVNTLLDEQSKPIAA